MNEADDNLNKCIEDKLRQAHQQVQLRPEWAAQVLSQMSAELKQGRNAESSLANAQPNHINDSRSWPKAMAIAAGILLAALGSILLTRSMNRSQSNDAADSLANNPTQRLPTDSNAPSTAPMDNFTPNASSVIGDDSVTDSAESVTAGTGYLVTQLSNEAEFEIYVVLPTTPINVAGNTK
jgi:hypothetical protein